MEILFHRDFKKQLDKLPPKIKTKFQERVELLVSNPKDERLRLHGLRGRWDGYSSFDVTGNVRVVFSYQSKRSIVLVAVGTHAQIYG